MYSNIKISNFTMIAIVSQEKKWESVVNLKTISKWNQMLEHKFLWKFKNNHKQISTNLSFKDFSSDKCLFKNEKILKIRKVWNIYSTVCLFNCLIMSCETFISNYHEVETDISQWSHHLNERAEDTSSWWMFET